MLSQAVDGLGPRRVLLVERDFAFRERAILGLQPLRCTVDSAADECQARELTDGFYYSLVFIGSTSSVADFQLCEQLRSGIRESKLPIVLCTDDAFSATVRRATAAGATDIAVRPVRWAIWAMRAQRLIESYEDAIAARRRLRRDLEPA